MNATLHRIYPIFNAVLLVTFAMWFGGFFFYVSFVVPIATEVLGSAFDQGMITRRVTMPLNYLGVVAGILMLIHSIATWNRAGSSIKHIQLVNTLLFLGMLICLFFLHPRIDAFVDLEAGEVIGDYEQFYFLHRLYLWASTIQWVAALVWIFCYASTANRDNNKC